MFRVGAQLPLTVVAPVPWFPFQSLLRLIRPHFRPDVPRVEVQQGVTVLHPRFLSVPGLFWTLSEGGRLVLPADGFEEELPSLPALIQREGVTHMCGAPIVLNMIINSKPDERRAFPQRTEVMTAGSAPPPPVEATAPRPGRPWPPPRAKDASMKEKVQKSAARASWAIVPSMPRRCEPAIAAESALHGCLRRFSGFRPWGGIGLFVLAVAGCSGRGDGATSGTQRPSGPSNSRTPSPFAEGIGHVGNQVKGIDAIPDYDDQAHTMRARAEPRLPDPLPSAKAACVTMLDAARQFYVDTEGEQSSAVATMAATRDADLRDCVEQTSPAAAACTAVMMAQSEGEFPWVLDQCSRAFPMAKGD